MNDVDLKILQRYASGAEIQKIADDHGIDKEDVTEAVSAVGFQRTRASALLREYEAKTRKPPAGVTFAPPGPAPAPMAAKPESPAEVPTWAEAGRILKRADEAGGRYAARASKLRASIVDLGRDLEAVAEVLAAQREVEQLRGQLADAAAKLKKLKSPSGAPPARDGSKVALNAEIRAWAAENDIPCLALGRIPQTVRDAYEGRTS